MSAFQDPRTRTDHRTVADQASVEACGPCGSEQIVVAVNVVGEPLSMTVCSVCGRRQWRSETAMIGLDRVLNRLRLVPTRRRRRENGELTSEAS
jgi:hypothetical protein